jgi:hypothetical protein
MKLKKLINLLYDEKTIPCDVIDFLNEEYESESLGHVNYGDIDLIHYIRSNLKYFKHNGVRQSMINKKKLKEIANIINN